MGSSVRETERESEGGKRVREGERLVISFSDRIDWHLTTIKWLEKNHFHQCLVVLAWKSLWKDSSIVEEKSSSKSNRNHCAGAVRANHHPTDNSISNRRKLLWPLLLMLAQLFLLSLITTTITFKMPRLSACFRRGQGKGHECAYIPRFFSVVVVVVATPLGTDLD